MNPRKIAKLVGYRLSSERLKRDMTMKDVQENSGIRIGSVFHWENGFVTQPFNILSDISNALNEPIHIFFPDRPVDCIDSFVFETVDLIRLEKSMSKYELSNVSLLPIKTVRKWTTKSDRSFHWKIPYSLCEFYGITMFDLIRQSSTD